MRKQELVASFCHSSKADFAGYLQLLLSSSQKHFYQVQGFRARRIWQTNIYRWRLQGGSKRERSKKLQWPFAEAIDFLNEAMERIPALRDRSALLEIRAKAKIDLAKRRIDTAKKRDTSSHLKFLAWESCRAYIEDAEKNLIKASHYVTNPVEADFVKNDLDFLERLKRIARKPDKAERGKLSNRRFSGNSQR